MQAYSYVRWSHVKQSKGDSLRRQTEMAAEYAKQHGLVLDNSTYQDHGISAFRGDNLVSGKLGTFLRAIDDGIVKTPCYLLVEALDRITRLELMAAMRLFISIIERGVTIVTLIDKQRYSAESINAAGGEMLLFGAMYALVQANRSNADRGGRVREAWDEKREKQKAGVIASAQCPAWLNVTPDPTAPGGRRFERDEAKVKVVKRVYKLCLSGHGSHKIAGILNKEAVPTFTKHSTRAKLWRVSSVQKILNNPAVHGLYKQTHGPTEIERYYPVVISKKDFDAAQAAQRGRRGSGGFNQAISNLFSHLTKCAYCKDAGLRYSFKNTQPRRPYLYCTGALVKACSARMLAYEPFESDLLTHLATRMWLDIRAHELDESIVSRRRDLELQASAKQAELEKLAEVAALAPEVAVIAEKLKGAQRHLNAIKAELSILVEDKMTENERDALTELLYSVLEDKDKDLRLKVRTALRNHIKRIEVAPRLDEQPDFWKEFEITSKPKHPLNMVKIVYSNDAVSFLDIIVSDSRSSRKAP